MVPSTGLNCSSRGRNIPTLTRVQRQPSGNPRLCQWTGPRKWRHDHIAQDPGGMGTTSTELRQRLKRITEIPQQNTRSNGKVQQNTWRQAILASHKKAKTTVEGGYGALVLEREVRKTYYSMPTVLEVKNLLSDIKSLNPFIVTFILR